ncbi:MAG: transporter substrate-binding domain-containing protein [Pseudomonadota bacterium]|nr:transporter substrate-binding domain-containing protein [Pseudomonadota bacterium]
MVVAFALLLGLGGAVVAGAVLSHKPEPSPPMPVSPPPSGASTRATPTVAVIGGLAAVRQRGSLRVAADPDAAPFLSRSAEGGLDGGLEGFEYGVMSALAAEAGVPLAVVPSTYAQLPERLRAGEADLAIGQLSPTGAWPGIAWTTSYLQYSHCLVVQKRSAATSLGALRGKRIGMYDDPVATQLVAATVGAAYERVVFTDYGYFEQLARGTLDAVVYDCPLARHELGAFGDNLRIADDALNVATYNVAVRADDAALQADVNRVLRDLGDQGMLARLEARWLGGGATASSAASGGYRTATGRVVVVQRGETLAAIAARELGSADRAPELHAANRDVLGDDADSLYAGLRLRIGK